MLLFGYCFLLLILFVFCLFVSLCAFVFLLICLCVCLFVFLSLIFCLFLCCLFFFLPSSLVKIDFTRNRVSMYSYESRASITIKIAGNDNVRS